MTNIHLTKISGICTECNGNIVESVSIPKRSWLRFVNYNFSTVLLFSEDVGKRKSTVILTDLRDII